MTSISKLLGIATLGASLSLGATAGTITAYYGDDDGFGIGATTGTIDPTVSHAAVGEAAGTDTRLIGDPFSFPAFGPAGGFAFALPSGSIVVGATLTMRVGSWTNNASPVDGPGSNLIKLDGQDVDAAFLASFTANQIASDRENIEERTINLTPDFFADMADGSVSLSGSNLSEASGFGSFQVDFLRLDITTRETADVPAPAPLGLLALGLGVLGVAKRRRA